MNEAETRTNLILPALQKAGWGTQEGSRIREEFPIAVGRLMGQGRRGQVLQADYVLEYKNRRLAVIEAKAKSKPYTEGVAQAKDYAQRLNIRFAYATNGLKIYQIDMTGTISEGDIDSFPSPEDLWQMCFPPPAEVSPQKLAELKEADAWKEQFAAVPFENKGGSWQPRYYQEVAIGKVLDAIAERKNRILLTLATGTGKTAIAFQIAWKLCAAKWNLRRDRQRLLRVLFLTDRNVLADQAFNAFGAFEEEALIRITPNDIRRRGAVPTNGSIFFTIFQSFMTGDGTAAYFGAYPNDFFDLVIIDECHRGGASDESSWREIMEHFSPAVQLGLTATPRRQDNVDTYDYFGEPVYSYSLKDGINDGFLTPFRLRQFQTTIDDYKYGPDDDVEQGEIDINQVYEEPDFNRNIEIREREAYRVKLFMEQINQQEKTLVFCANQAHALLIRDLINQNAKKPNPDYCHRVTADEGALGEQHLRNFRDNEKTIPTILTTSQKLSTGVDAPEVRNIVLLRRLGSMIEFKQIIGRGTRLYDGKNYFTIYDFVKAHTHFQDAEWDGEPLCPRCGEAICRCDKQPHVPCPKCGNTSCTCQSVRKKCQKCNNIPCVCEKTTPKMIKVKLGDKSRRSLKHNMATLFFDKSGQPISAEEFIAKLFGALPALFSDEEELRKIWSMPDTRKKLLEALDEQGYSPGQLQGLQQLVGEGDSDLFDVLIYIAYNKEVIPRAARAARAKKRIGSYSPEQREFLNFILEQYSLEGHAELDLDKISQLIELKYGSISDAKEHLGEVNDIRRIFIALQEEIYSSAA